MVKKDAPALADQIAALSQKAVHNPKKAPHRELGMLLLIAGDAARAQEHLAAALARESTDGLTRLAASLAALETGATQVAHEHWLSLLEQAVVREPTDPWSPAVSELAAYRLLSHGMLGTGPADEQKLSERLLGLWQKRAHLPLEAQQFLGALLGQTLRLQKDETRAEQVDLERGCPPIFYLTGPHGQLPKLDLLTAMSADHPANDPARSTYKTRLGKGCGVQVPGVSSQPGVFFASIFFRTRDGRPVPLTVETAGSPWALYIDGQRHFHDTEPVSRRYLDVQVPAGWHVLTVKLGASSDNHLQIALPGVSFYDGHPADAPPITPGSVVVKRRDLAQLPVAQNQWQAAFSALLRMQQAALAGQADAGLAIAAANLSLTPQFASLRTLFASLLLEDQSRPDRLARDGARSQLKIVLTTHPQMWSARQALCRLLLQDDKAQQAQEVFEAVPIQPSWRAHHLRYRILKARGFSIEAKTALDEALKLGPTACPLLETLADFLQEQQDDRGRLAAAQRLSACNPYSERWAETLLEAGRLAEAQAEYERLVQLSPENPTGLRGLLRVQRAERALGPAVNTLAKLGDLSPHNVRNVIDLANLHIERDQPKTALQLLEQALLQQPQDAELAKAHKVLSQKDALAPYRLDGTKVIADFEARHGAYSGEPAVMLLDRVVLRVFPGGARVALTHNIIRVLTKEGIDHFGEIRIPEGAEVLKLRTIKANGKIFQPEDIPEKDTVSAPALEIGDYVEYEYIDRDDPSPLTPEGFLADRFYFASTDAPLDRSEFLLVTPKNMPLQVDLRGPKDPARLSDRPTASQKTDGDLLHHFWQRTQVARSQIELPMDQGLSEDWSPSVRVGSGVSFAAYVNQFRERRYRSFRLSHKLTALAEQVAGLPDGSPESPASLWARTRALDAWVRGNIHPGGSFDEAASSILARRQGRREVVLAALLLAAGIRAETWLVRPENNPKLQGPLQDVLAYSEPLIAIAPDAHGVPLFWVDPLYKHSPTGLVRPLLRGAEALRVPLENDQPKSETVQMGRVDLSHRGGLPKRLLALLPNQPPVLPMLTDHRTLDFTAVLEATGAAKVQVKETLTGIQASEWRDQVEHLPRDKLQKNLEQRALGFYFPGASLTRLSYGPIDRDDEPLVVEYSFSAPQLARQRVGQGGEKGLVLPVPYPLLLSRRYVTVPKRQYPLLFGYITPSTLRAHIKLPANMRVVQVAESFTAQGNGFGQYSRRAQAATAEVSLEVQTDFPRQRIDPSAYRPFVDFAAQVDVAEEAFALLAVD